MRHPLRNLKLKSKMRHKSKYKLVQMCIEKENQGWYCVEPIKQVSHYHKDFKRDGNRFEFVGTDTEIFYEATYTRDD